MATANTTLSGQPTFTDRVPNGTDYTGVTIYVEASTVNTTGSPVVTIGYTNQSGVSGRSSGSIGLGTSQPLGRLTKIPLQAGDTGVSRINSVVCAGGVEGAFNVLLVRDLHVGRIMLAYSAFTDGLDKTGMAEIFLTSALNVVPITDSTTSGTSGGFIEIASA
jgi:hypothetical protein